MYVLCLNKMAFSNVVRVVVPMMNGACSSGSGFVIDVTKYLPDNPSVFFVTNGHVVDGAECSTVKVHTTFEPRALDARIVSICYDADLALLELCPSAREYTKQLYGHHIWKPIEFVSSPPEPGAKIVCVGHPLGIERQTQAKGDIITYMQTTDPNTVDCTVAMTGTVCNPGCSGGPALTRDVHLCVGMNSFKLRNATDIDGMSGIRPAHVIKQLIPAMLSPIAKNMEQRKDAFTVLKSMLGKSAGNVLQFLPSHVKDVSKAANIFKENAIGGRSDGSNARTLRSFLRRHVIDVDSGEHGLIRPGGAAVLARALDQDIKAISNFRAGRTWTKVRQEEATQPLVSVLPAIPQPPALISMPILGVECHGTHDSSLSNMYMNMKDNTVLSEGLLTYKKYLESDYCPQGESEQTKYVENVLQQIRKDYANSQFNSTLESFIDVVPTKHKQLREKLKSHVNGTREAYDVVPEGGAVITSVLRNSLYEKAGGAEEEIVYKVKVAGKEHDIGVDGKVYCASTKTRITLRDVVCRQSLGDVVSFHVLTPEGRQVVRSVNIAVPSYDEIPHVHMIHNMENTQMVKDQKENMNVGGLVLTTLRLNHALQMNMSEFLDESKRYSFHAVVAHVSPTSPCWGHGGIQVGSVITHVNGVPATTDGWDEFCEQMAGAVEKGHLMLKTRLGPKRGLFCAITQ